MKKNLIAAVIMASLVFTGCNSDSGDPKVPLTAFIDAISKKDFATAKKFATKDSEKVIEALEKGTAKIEMEKFGSSNALLGEPKIDGDRATVEVKAKDKGESINFYLRKESGTWKVALDKASMIQMMMGKMAEKGMNMNNVLDSLDEGMKKMKDMNMDSLDGEIKESLEKMDKNKDKLENVRKMLEEHSKKLEQ